MTTRTDAWLAEAVNSRLKASENPLIEAQLLTAHVIQRPRTWVVAHPEYIFSQQEESLLRSLLDRLTSGEPLPYLLGHWAFYGLDFYVSEAVLIPRPETELLVEAALRWLALYPHRRRVADIGTGSACIAISLANKVADLKVIAADISRTALSIAMRNVLRYNLSPKIFLLQTDLLAGCAGPFDLVCANLPYIPFHKLPALPVSSHEPALALDGGPGGLEIIHRLLVQSKNKMAERGLILLEIEAEQGNSAPDLAKSVFPLARIQVGHDLAGHPRLLSIHL